MYMRGELHTEYWESEGKIPLAKYRRRCKDAMDVGPCRHGMARPQVADGGTVSYMEGSCE
jgi:hypothetical protein